MVISSLLRKYEAIDNAHGTDKGTTHSYADVYDALFAPYVSRDAGGETLDVLEIGIFSGAFLEVVSQLLPRARVDGIDVTLANIKFGQGNPAIRTLELDGTDAATPGALGRQYDIIIEDASHRPADQVRTLEVFAPVLKPGGAYVIEDIDDQAASYVYTGVSQLAAQHGLVLEWHDLRHIKGRFDDIVAILRRPV